MGLRPLADELLAEYFRLSPVHATEIGIHDHDGLWPDLTDAGLEERSRFLHSALERIDRLDSEALSRDDAIDRSVLRSYLDADLFATEVLDEPAWSPMTYVYLAGNGLFTLLAREFAPRADRLASAASRMRALPALLDQARARLTATRRGEHGSGSAREVSRFHTEKAIETMPGVADLARTAASEAQELDDEESMHVVQTAARSAVEAVDAYVEWLRDELLPHATGDFRLGRNLHDHKFRHFLKTEITPDQLAERAQAGFDEVRAEMVALARRLWPQWMGSEPMPDDDGAAVRGVLDAIALQHPAAEDLLDYCRDENARIEAFVRERDLVGLAEEPMQIIWTPPFLRAFGGAMLIPPGPLDRGLDSFFAITPMPDDWTDEQRESRLREDNNRQLRLLTIHEAVPGHYLQLAYSNRCPSTVRAVFQSGVFAEGWAVYITQVMMDVGYGADDPALMLVHLKFYLRSITNVLIDIGIHAGEMNEHEAMRLMVEGGFQEQSEAANKWDRARLSSTQLCEYYLGAVEMTDLEHEARRRAEAAGAPFVYRPFLESVLAHGSPPMPVIRDILFG
ncbi:MAG: DUF885 domain-containing protein [Chloroflexi bacterium]|nr:MAG: DUF885 domain-containing protein [Chloroflexota bacterium]